MKKEVRNHPITTALPEDRKKYLDYCIAMLDTITETDKYEFCRIAGKPPALYTTKDIAEMIKGVMYARTSEYTYEAIAESIGLSVEAVETLERFAKLLIKEKIGAMKREGIPIIGGMN